MKAALSPPSDGLFEVDGGEVRSKGPVESGSRCSSWTNEKHMLYLSSLEDSFVNQLNGSQFHLHLMNLLGRSRTNQRQSDSSITTESLSDASQFKSLQQGSQRDLKFVKTTGDQKLNTSFSLSEIQWIKHFAPNISGKVVNIRANCQNGDGYGEVSDQNFIKEDITGAELSLTYKKKRLSSPVPPLFIDQVVLGKQNQDAITERINMTALINQI